MLRLTLVDKVTTAPYAVLGRHLDDIAFHDPDGNTLCLTQFASS